MCRLYRILIGLLVVILVVGKLQAEVAPKWPQKLQMHGVPFQVLHDYEYDTWCDRSGFGRSRLDYFILGQTWQMFWRYDENPAKFYRIINKTNCTVQVSPSPWAPDLPDFMMFDYQGPGSDPNTLNYTGKWTQEGPYLDHYTEIEFIKGTSYPYLIDPKNTTKFYFKDQKTDFADSVFDIPDICNGAEHNEFPVNLGTIPQACDVLVCQNCCFHVSRFFYDRV